MGCPLTGTPFFFLHLFVRPFPSPAAAGVAAAAVCVRACVRVCVLFFRAIMCKSFGHASRLLTLEVDTPIANVAGKIAQALAGGISSEQKASVKVLLDSITSSRMWPRFVEMMEEQKVCMWRVIACVGEIVFVLVRKIWLFRLGTFVKYVSLEGCMLTYYRGPGIYIGPNLVTRFCKDKR